MYSSEPDLRDSNSGEKISIGQLEMVKTPTRRRAIFGIAIFAVGLIIPSLMPISLDNVLFSSSTAFISIAMIVLGISLIGNIPFKKIFLGLFVACSWFFLFAVPFSLLPFPPVVSPIVISFSGLALVLVAGLYEKRKTRTETKKKHIEANA